MTHFPVTNSNLSAKHLGLLLQNKYALGSDATCSLIKSGINDTYLVVDKEDKYVFRVYSFNWRTREEILEEIKLLNQLKGNGISISYPIPNIGKTYIETLHAPEGDRFGVLFSYANGQKVQNVSAETHFKIGVLIAKMHNVTCDQTLNRLNYTPDVLLVNSLMQLERFLPAHTEEMRFMLSTQEFLLKELSKVIRVC